MEELHTVGHLEEDSPADSAEAVLHTAVLAVLEEGSPVADLVEDTLAVADPTKRRTSVLIFIDQWQTRRVKEPT